MLPFLRRITRLLRRPAQVATLILLLAALSFSPAGSAAPSPAAAPSGPDQPSVPPLFLDLRMEALGIEPPLPPSNPAATRERLARVDLALLTDPARNQVLQLNLFDDATIIAERTEAGPVFGDGFAWVGRVPGEAFSSVILVQVNNAMAGMVVDGVGQTYEIRYAGDGRHVLRQIDTMRFPDEAPPLQVPAGMLQEQPVAPDSPLADDSSRLDIMIVYSDDARAAAGGTDAMKAEVYLAVEVTNQAYVDSGVTQRLALVHTSEIAYAETGNSSTDLGRLQNSSDGQIDQVPTLRDRYGADLVSFLVDNLDYCGRGYVMDPVSSTFAPYAYNVVDRECASTNLSMAHELGHNMGGLHDWYTDAGTTPYSYGHGFVDLVHHWRTIMAYADECGAQSPPVACPRIGRFSNPSLNYGGNPTGIAIGTNTTCTAGNLSNPDCDADMHTVLNNTRATVAGFRSTSPGRSDAWMKDTWEDTGGEPDAYTAGQDMWKSPYLWVRNAPDPNRVHQHEHENPINTVTNYVYAKLQNGSESSMAGTLRLYWADAAAGLSWPADWTNFANVPITLPANSSQVAEGTWVPSGTGHYCLLARWDSTADPMHAEGAVVDTNVRSNNNIIWKNVEVVPFTGPDCEKERPLPVIIRNVGNLSGREVEMLDLLFRPGMETGSDWLQYFDYVHVVPGDLMDRWKSMEGFQPVSRTRLQLVDAKGGALLGIGMKYREATTIQVIAKPSCKNFPGDLTAFGLEVMQVAQGDQMPVGGVSYAVSLRPQPSQLITVTGSKFDDRNGNGSWDEDGSEPPLPGWEIRADNLQGTLHFSDVTDATGRYRLVLPRDMYKIYEVHQQGWTQTVPAAGEYGLDLREVQPGTVLQDIDFGNQQRGQLGDFGDAPDSTNHAGAAMTAYPLVPARYPTVFRDPPPGTTRGPAHAQPRAQAWLGRGVSLEWDADVPPDEDIITNLVPPADRADRDRYDDGIQPAELKLPNCAPASLKYDVHATLGGIRQWYANIWMDFNRDGDWEDKFECRTPTGQSLVVAEWAVQNQAVNLGAGDHTLSTPNFVAVRPPDEQDPMWMRITLAEQPAPSPFDGSGPERGYAYGETEDYLLGLPAMRPDLVITKRADGQFRYGENAVYWLEVKNQGTGIAAAPITVQDELPPGLAFISAMGEGWSCAARYQMVACQYAGNVAPGAMVAPIRLMVQVALYGAAPAPVVRNCAAVQVTSDVDESNNVTCISTRFWPTRTYLPLILRQ
jgi:uncharacterized repeat protein (TIGR01451 family)